MDIRENITWLLYNEEASQRADIAGIFEIYSEKLKVRLTIFRDSKHISRRAYFPTGLSFYARGNQLEYVVSKCFCQRCRHNDRQTILQDCNEKFRVVWSQCFLGYGDIVPVTFAGKVCTILYALYGIPVFIWYIVKLGALFRVLVMRLINGMAIYAKYVHETIIEVKI